MFHLDAIVLCCFGLIFGVWIVASVWFLHLGFLHGFRLGPIGLLSVITDDCVTVRASSAHGIKSTFSEGVYE